jgi:hypothetical protein
MGRTGKGSAYLVGRLESGKAKSPSLRLVADYLRACRARFADIADLLDAYTGQPIVPEKQATQKVAGMIALLPAPVSREVRNYDLAARPEPGPTGPSPEDIARRLRRAEKFARAALWRRKLHTYVVSVINTRKLRPGPASEALLQAHARRLWGILNRTRGKAVTLRRQQLAEADKWLRDQNVVDPEHLRIISEETTAFFVRAEESGDIDGLIVPGFGPGAKSRAEDDRQRLLHEYGSARDKLIGQLWDETRPALEAEGAAGKSLALYRQLLVQCCTFVDYNAPESDERHKGVEEYVANDKYQRMGLDPEKARRMAGAAMTRYDELRKTLPPDPRGWTREA